MSIRPTKHIGGPLFVVIRLANIIHVDLADVKVYAVMPNTYLVALFAPLPPPTHERVFLSTIKSRLV